MGSRTVPCCVPLSVYETTPYSCSSSSSSSSSSANPPHLQKRNVPHDSVIAMRFSPTHTRIAAIKINLNCIRSHRPRLFCAAESKGPMADEADKDSKLGGESSTLNADKKEEERDKEKLLPPPPPPPEKPLPGDCCGSGCVRCVWDIYYEELEDYDRILAEIKGKCIPGSK